MPNRKRCFLSLAFVIGGFSLGTLSLDEAYGAHRHFKAAGHFKAAVAGIVRFHHDVFLRDGSTFYAETRAETRPRSRGARGYARALPPRRKFRVETPALPRSARSYAAYTPERRAFPAPSLRAAEGSQLWLQPTSFTPYDRYMGSVRSVINHLQPHSADMSRACQLMQEGRHFEYVTGDPYSANPPSVTAMEQAGDCKAKALWLYHGLGDANALFVIGKTTRFSRTSHAWVYWRNENRWWILDCTNRSQPIAADSVPEDHYVPYYSYGRNGSFRHKATRLLINPLSPNSGTPAVADH